MRLTDMNVFWKEEIMEKFNELLRNFDLAYFGTGQHKIGMEKALSLIKDEKVIILDVRSREEIDMLDHKFALSIPLNELPDRLDELSKDKMIAIFCTSGTRSTIASIYLQVNGFEQVKIVPESLSEIANIFKPGYVYKNSKA